MEESKGGRMVTLASVNITRRVIVPFEWLKTPDIPKGIATFLMWFFIVLFATTPLVLVFNKLKEKNLTNKILIRK